MAVSHGLGAPSLAVLGPRGVVVLAAGAPRLSQGFGGAGRPAWQPASSETARVNTARYRTARKTKTGKRISTATHLTCLEPPHAAARWSGQHPRLPLGRAKSPAAGGPLIRVPAASAPLRSSPPVHKAPGSCSAQEARSVENPQRGSSATLSLSAYSESLKRVGSGVPWS